MKNTREKGYFPEELYEAENLSAHKKITAKNINTIII